MSGPTFFIVGAPKAGTSSMAAYLGQHPELFLPDRKDIPFFGSDLDYRRPRPTSEEYDQLFGAVAPDFVSGEACVSYLQSRRAAAEIADFEPAAKIIVMLRDPADAIPSMHAHLRYVRGEDIDDLQRALEAEPDRSAGRRVPVTARLADALRYRDVFTYSPQLERYLNCFQREQILILLFEDLKRDAAAAVSRTYAFLSVDPTFVPEISVANARKSVRLQWLQSVAMNPPPLLLRSFNAVVPPSRRGRLMPFLTRLNTTAADTPKLDPKLESALREGALPDLLRLEGLIARDLSTWTRRSQGIDAELDDDRAKPAEHRFG